MADRSASRRDQDVVKALVDMVRLPPDHRFQRDGELGRGGVGNVEALRDNVLQRRAAVKTMHLPVPAQPVLARAFLREAQITAQLDHPNIVPVHDVGMDDNGRLSFSMKEVAGRTLSEEIEALHALPTDSPQAFGRLVELLEVLVKVADAVAFAHSRGVLHCDLKPQNVLIGDFGQAYLMDWGFAQLLPAPDDARAQRWVRDLLPQLPPESTDRIVLGTPGYMPPEQAWWDRSKFCEATDVFALGATLYAILSGHAPYQGTTPRAVLEQAQQGRWLPLVPSADGTRGVRPRHLVRLAERAMAPDLAERLPTALAFKAELQRFLRGGDNFVAIRVKAGATIVNEGDAADCAYIIAKGSCEVFKTVSGQRAPLQVLGPGEAFGEMALLTGSPRTASVVAREDCMLYVVSRDALEQELTSMTPWMGALVRSLATRFRAAQDRLLSPAYAVPPPLPPEDEVEVELLTVGD